jgi:hypothetical protein
MNDQLEPKELEEQRAVWAWKYFDSRRAEFDRVNLRFDIHPVRRMGSGETYDSELEIFIYRDDAFRDARYYRLVRGTNVLASDETWQREVISDVDELLANANAE